jgi:Outer membrane protein beta-barrel domain
MQKGATTICVLATMIAVAYGGTETYSSGKEMKQVTQVPPCPEWYRDTEFNISLWGTYIFTANNWEDDRYIESDHAWGGGVDVKYFFHRYFGVGVEGWAAESTRRQFDGFDFNGQPVFSDDSRIIGAVKGTFTLRYPIHCSRFSPYVYGGVGAIFGGGERDSFTELLASDVKAVTVGFPATHSGSDTRVFGQAGAGLEIRLTPHIGVMSDFSWNVVDGPENNFGMVRSGVTFAF